MDILRLKSYLDSLVLRYNHISFIQDDPISIPKQFSKRQDIEIIGFWTAMLAWGRRSTIIAKAGELAAWMDNSPYDFILNHKETDRKPFLNFKHRTFQGDDALYFLHFFQSYYQHHNTLEDAFLVDGHNAGIKQGLIRFYETFTGDPLMMSRTKKHVSTPAKNSACKRLNMFLRWMVRKDAAGVDFGIWTRLRMEDLMIPLDVHVAKVARRLGLLDRTKDDWMAVDELTTRLIAFNPSDPIIYDYALFSLGVNDFRELPS
ncbi:MAG: TIGR02757 family protein [Saprospiraceae bacterium]|nr:TIGR02757 family protein [Saprospiraceae bacterium]MBX7179906.1 TIGR02757 family protein [Saprospiraceae bacterium]MCB0591818.1 TIGR02757 family protein [Saprospiraceae bacterium]MCC7148483.1 TIGR02757 family protein [Saprospiraceae bacterium]MCO5284753.1 TIGR02757 family protein [Saprospiraceae bacterium]